MSHPGFAPREVFETVMIWAPIVTFDLILEQGDGVVVVRRKIPPYKNVWAFPGLRMYKGEEINDTLKRIAKLELGIDIDPTQKRFVGQYVGKFKTECRRQDVSTCYAVRLSDDTLLTPNSAHFSGCRIVTQIPKQMGAMYRYYLQEYGL